jgi:peroxiredoxin
MKRLRYFVPIFGLFALIALFFKLPETPNLFGILGCKTCSVSDPYLTLIGAGYFAALVAVSLLFPSFPGLRTARGGLTWAVLLALSLTYLNLPSLCPECLIGHACNILIWTIWVIVPAKKKIVATTFRERLCVTLFAPISVVALFSCLNLTFMAYDFKTDRNVPAMSLQLGDDMPAFVTQTIGGRSISKTDASRNASVIINFISSDCSHCKEQLLILNEVASQLSNGAYRFINVSSSVPNELVQNFSSMEWVEDAQGKLRKLFNVSGYPSLFVVANGKIALSIPGVSEQFKEDLLVSLAKAKGISAF